MTDPRYCGAQDQIFFFLPIHNLDALINVMSKKGSSTYYRVFGAISGNAHGPEDK